MIIELNKSLFLYKFIQLNPAHTRQKTLNKVTENLTRLNQVTANRTTVYKTYKKIEKSYCYN